MESCTTFVFLTMSSPEHQLRNTFQEYLQMEELAEYKSAFYQDRKDVITNPVVVVEVLSDGTAAWDRGGKFR